MPAPDYAVEIGQLQDAMASGEAEIEGANGERLRYRSVSEIRLGIAYFQQLAAVAASSSASQFGATVASFDRF